MTNFDKFRLFCQKNRHQITVKGTSPEWPYDYGTSIAYLVTLDNTTKYFYFNDDGIMLVNKFYWGNK